MFLYCVREARPFPVFKNSMLGIVSFICRAIGSMVISLLFYSFEVTSQYPVVERVCDISNILPCFLLIHLSMFVIHSFVQLEHIVCSHLFCQTGIVFFLSRFNDVLFLFFSLNILFVSSVRTSIGIRPAITRDASEEPLLYALAIHSAIGL